MILMLFAKIFGNDKIQVLLVYLASLIISIATWKDILGVIGFIVSIAFTCYKFYIAIKKNRKNDRI